MRVLFLDIDDVLLTVRSHALPENAARLAALHGGASASDADRLPVRFDPVAVAWLNRTTETSEACIVIHSSWRHHFGLDDTASHVRAQGVLRLHPKAPCCPVAQTPMDKSADIDAWLAAAARRGEVIEDYAILDDHLIDPPDSDGVLVRIDPRTGYGPEAHLEVLRRFGFEETLIDLRIHDRAKRA